MFAVLQCSLRTFKMFYTENTAHASVMSSGSTGIKCDLLLLLRTRDIFKPHFFFSYIFVVAFIYQLTSCVIGKLITMYIVSEQNVRHRHYLLACYKQFKFKFKCSHQVNLYIAQLSKSWFC